MAEYRYPDDAPAHHYAKGYAMGKAGASVCSHNLPRGTLALDNWLTGHRAGCLDSDLPQSHIALAGRQRFDARQECAA